MRQVRRSATLLATLVLGGLALTACGSSSGGSTLSTGNSGSLTTSPVSTASTSGSGCPTTEPTVAHPAQFKAPTGKVSPTKYVMKITFACKGTVTIAMNGAKTPKTIQSFAFLAAHKWFNDTPCHRLTTPATGIDVLQCGDPTGTGTGGPGYTIPDENLGQYKAASNGYALYPAGSVAMANTGQPHSGGSQFFLNYGPSHLMPAYTPFGKVTSGLSILKSIAAAGVAGGQNDGPPANPVEITSLTVTKG